MFLNRAAGVLLVLSVALNQRVLVDFYVGRMAPLTVAFIAVAALIWVRDGLVTPRRSRYRAVSINTAGPLLALMALLPAIGVVIGWYAPGSLYALVLPGFAVAVLSLARAKRIHGLDLTNFGFALVLIHGLYGLGQTMFRLGILPAQIWQPAADWDAKSQLALSDAYLILGRSTGLFVNANHFGLWSCLAILYSAMYLGGKRRAIGIVLGLLGVVGSQSRTAWLALGVLAVALLAGLLRDPRVARKVAGWSLFAGPLVLVAWLMGWLSQLVEGALVQRLASGLGVVEGGVEADANLLGRVDNWGRAMDFSASYPLGTFGPPQVLFKSFTDNEYVSMFLQGSVLLLAAYVLALLSPLVLASRGVPRAGALGIASVLVAVFSLTMLPFEASASAAALIWLMCAQSLGDVQSGEDLDVIEAPPARNLRPSSV